MTALMCAANEAACPGRPARSTQQHHSRPARPPPLHRLECARALLRSGADPNFMNKAGEHKRRPRAHIKFYGVLHARSQQVAH